MPWSAWNAAINVKTAPTARSAADAESAGTVSAGKATTVNSAASV